MRWDSFLYGTAGSCGTDAWTRERHWLLDDDEFLYYLLLLFISAKPFPWLGFKRRAYGAEGGGAPKETRPGHDATTSAHCKTECGRPVRLFSPSRLLYAGRQYTYDQLRKAFRIMMTNRTAASIRRSSRLGCAAVPSTPRMYPFEGKDGSPSGCRLDWMGGGTVPYEVRRSDKKGAAEGVVRGWLLA